MILCFSLLAFLLVGAEELPHTAQGWSQDLLARLLSAPGEGERSNGQAAEGMVLRSYQLRGLRLGDPGRATNLVSILQRMMPPDSRVTEDRASNTLHVLSSSGAQQACLELVSAMDGEESGVPLHPEPAVVPEEVRKALENLAAARPDADQLMKIVADASQRMEERVSEAVRLSNEDSRASLRRMLITGGFAFVGLVVFAVAGVFMIARRTRERQMELLAKKEMAALALVPTQGIEAVILASRDQQERTKELQKLMESFSISYQADRERHRGLMEAVAQKHGELTATLGQMEQFRQEIGDSAGRLFLEVNREAIDQVVSRASHALEDRAVAVGLIAESASRKMEETADRLEVQNTRAQALADELERTQHEVDALFEKLAHAQSEAQQAQGEANEQRRIAYEKSAQLAKKEAALAGLSLLMQEPIGTILETLNDPLNDLTEGTNAVEANHTDLAPGSSPSPGPFEPPTSEDVAGDCFPDETSCPRSNSTYRIVPVS